MKITQSLFISAVLPLLLAAQSVPDLKTFRREVPPSSVPVFWENFENPQTQKLWFTPPQFKRIPMQGRSSTTALYRSSKNKREYTIASRTVPNLIPGVLYELSVWTRGNYANTPACVEFFSAKGKWLSGSYYPLGGQTPANNTWHETKIRFKAPDAKTVTKVCLCISDRDEKDRFKEMYWDEIKISRVVECGADFYPVNIPNLQLNDAGTINIGYLPVGQTAAEKNDLALYVNANGVKKLLFAKDGIFSGNFGKFAPGKVKAEVKLLNLKRKTIIAENVFTFYKSTPKKVRGTAYFDEYGRCIVDGKPMMILGVFARDIPEKVIKDIRDLGFNAVMPYTFTTNYRPVQPRIAANRNTFKRMKDSLDLLQKYNVKLIMPLLNVHVGEFDGVRSAFDAFCKKVELVREHPAFLMHYIADEVPRQDIAFRKKYREKIAELDPNHPVFAVGYVPDEFIYQRQICDIFGFDPYPINEINVPAIRSSRAGLIFNNTQLPFHPFCLVPQAWKACLTERQMLCCSLQGVVHGVRNFMLYAYDCDKDDETIKKQIPYLKNVAAQLKELEPWIMSLEKAPDVSVRQEKNNGSFVDVKAFRANGRDCIVIVSTGPEDTSAVITVNSDQEFTSKYGNTVKIGKGQYRFTGKSVNCDVLLPVNKK